jgi:DNA gyrase subunit A
MATKEGDFVEHLFVASAHSYLLVFTQESGRVYWIKVHEIPQAGPAAKGKAIVNLLQLTTEERVAATVAVREFAADRYLVFVTEQGTIKKTPLSEYGNPRAGGIIAVNIDKGDRLLAVALTDGSKDLFLATAKGKSIRFPESEARPMGRATTGVRGIKLRKGDKVVGMAVFEPGGAILTAAERGIGKRTPVEQYRSQGRGGLGIINLKIAAKTGPVVGVRMVMPGDQVLLITEEGMIIRTAVDGIREIGRSTQGVKLIDLEGKDRLVALAKVVEREDEGDDDPSGQQSVN